MIEFFFGDVPLLSQRSEPLELLDCTGCPPGSGSRALTGRRQRNGLLGLVMPARALDLRPEVLPFCPSNHEAYRTEVKQALMDAMLDHSSSLGIQPTEWLTIAARRNDDRPRLAPADTDAQTFFIRLRGSDLAAFLARQISREEALQRIEVRVF